MICVPEAYKIVRVLNTTAAASFTLSDYISCKNVHRVWFVISHQGAGDTDLTLALDEATTVAGTTHAAVTATFPIWKDTDHGTTSDALVRQTDAASDVIDPATEGGLRLHRGQRIGRPRQQPRRGVRHHRPSVSGQSVAHGPDGLVREE